VQGRASKSPCSDAWKERAARSYTFSTPGCFISEEAFGRIVGPILSGEEEAVTNSPCAIRRRALEQAGGFEAEVRTGVDYDLGKRLRQHGTRTRYEVDGSFPVEFHTQIGSYLRQQARWLRNVVIHVRGLRAKPGSSCAFPSRREPGCGVRWISSRLSDAFR
jgi:hypothetical protein